jgi:hypothetical protein
MRRPRPRAAIAGALLLLLVGAGGASSAAASSGPVEITCAPGVESAAAQLRALTLPQQREYLALCGLPAGAHPGCFSFSLGSTTTRCPTCHTKPGRVVLRS